MVGTEVSHMVHITSHLTLCSVGFYSTIWYVSITLCIFFIKFKLRNNQPFIPLPADRSYIFLQEKLLVLVQGKLKS